MRGLRLAVVGSSSRSVRINAFDSLFPRGYLCSTQRRFSNSNQLSHDRSECVRKSSTLRLMPLGGSITFGVGSSDGNGYRKPLLDKLIASNYNVQFVGSRKSGSMTNNNHEGWRGYRIDQISTKAKISASTLLPDIITLNAGSNDCIQNTGLDKFDARISELTDCIWSTCPHSTIVLSTLLKQSDEKVNTRVQEVNSQIRDLVESKASDGSKIVLADMCSTDSPQIEDLVDDGVHPNDLGYAKMAEIWFKSIQTARHRGFL